MPDVSILVFPDGSSGGFPRFLVDRAIAVARIV